MRRKLFGLVAAASLLLVVIIVLIFEFMPAATVTIGEIELDRSAIAIRMKGKVRGGNAVKLDDIVLELAEEQMILQQLKGTAQDITKDEYDAMRQSAQEGYEKNREENDAYLEKYHMSKDELIEWDLSMTVRAMAKGRYLLLIYDELVSEYEQTYGTDESVDSEKMVEVLNQHTRQMASRLPAIHYNRREIKEMTKAFEAWTQSLDDSIPLPDIQLSY